MASIESYTTAQGKRYRVTYRTPNHKQTTKRGFKTKRDAERFRAEMEVSQSRGEYIEPAAAKARVADLDPAWLTRQTHLKPSALRPVESAWRIYVLPTWGTTAVADIRKTAVQQWISEITTGDDKAKPPSKPKSATTVIRAYGVLAAILDEAVDDRRILTNPA